MSNKKLQNVLKSVGCNLTTVSKTDNRLPFCFISWWRLIFRCLYLFISVTFTWHLGSFQKLREHNETDSSFTYIPYVAVGYTGVSEYKLLLWFLFSCFPKTNAQRCRKFCSHDIRGIYFVGIFSVFSKIKFACPNGQLHVPFMLPDHRVHLPRASGQPFIWRPVQGRFLQMFQ